MKTGFLLQVGGNKRMAGEAKIGLLAFFEGFMATLALLFELRVGVNQWAGHDQLLDISSGFCRQEEKQSA